MAERLPRQGPLDALGLVARARADAEEGTEAGVALAPGEPRGLAVLRGDGGEPAFLGAAAEVLGFALPTEANTAGGHEDLSRGARVLWLGPDEWLVVSAGDDGTGVVAALRAALHGLHAAVVAGGDGRAVIRLAGPRARDVLAKGCPLDLDPREFPAGACAQSLVGGMHALIHAVSMDARGRDPVYEVYVHRSFAAHMWSWLEDAGREYGVRVGSGSPAGLAARIERG